MCRLEAPSQSFGPTRTGCIVTPTDRSPAEYAPRIAALRLISFCRKSDSAARARPSGPWSDDAGRGLTRNLAPFFVTHAVTPPAPVRHDLLCRRQGDRRARRGRDPSRIRADGARPAAARRGAETGLPPTTRAISSGSGRSCSRPGTFSDRARPSRVAISRCLHADKRP
jgi:hypothetical protein